MFSKERLIKIALTVIVYCFGVTMAVTGGEPREILRLGSNVARLLHIERHEAAIELQASAPRVRDAQN